MNQELQNYINQQRTAGMTDEQIRQALGTQGWTQADLDEAFGVMSSGPVVPQASVKSNTGKIITVIVLIILILVIGLAGWLYYKSTQSGININLKERTIERQSSPNVSNQFSQKICGDMPKNKKDEDGLQYLKALSKIDSSMVANGTPIYPTAVKITQLQNPDSQQIIACAKSTSVSEVVSYYQNMPGYSSYDGSTLDANYDLFGVRPEKVIIKGTSSEVRIYDAGRGDILIVYLHP